MIGVGIGVGVDIRFSVGSVSVQDNDGAQASCVLKAADLLMVAMAINAPINAP